MVSIRQIFQKSRTYAALTVLLSMYMVGYMRHVLVVNFRHANNHNAEIVYGSENISWLQEFIKNYHNGSDGRNAIDDYKVIDEEKNVKSRRKKKKK